MGNILKKKLAAYDRWAEYSNVNIDYSSQLSQFINKINNNENFTFLRISDGEYFHLFLEKKNIETDLDSHTSEVMCKELLFMIEQQKIDDSIIVSILEGTVYDKPFKNDMEKLFSNLLGKFSSSLFSWASVTENIGGLFLSLMENKRPIILVGPNYLTKINKFTINEFVETPESKCWEHQESIENKVHEKIQNYDNPIILYACSVTAKIAISKFYKLYKHKITQIDFGAALDVYAGVKSRPWHREMDYI